MVRVSSTLKTEISFTTIKYSTLVSCHEDSQFIWNTIIFGLDEKNWFVKMVFGGQLWQPTALDYNNHIMVLDYLAKEQLSLFPETLKWIFFISMDGGKIWYFGIWYTSNNLSILFFCWLCINIRKSLVYHMPKVYFFNTQKKLEVFFSWAKTFFVFMKFPASWIFFFFIHSFYPNDFFLPQQ